CSTGSCQASQGRGRMLPAPLMFFSTDFGLPEYVSAPAPAMDAFSVPVTLTSACEAPTSDTVAVSVCRDLALSLHAPAKFASRFATDPSALIDDAPLDSSFNSGPESLPAVK